MWCPQCKNEYVDGITVCPKCDVDLVDSLDEEVEDKAAKIAAGRNASGLDLKAVYDPEATKIFMASMDERFSENVVDAGYSTENAMDDEREVLEKMKEASDEIMKKRSSKVVYQNKNAKAEDVKSSAVSLLIVGILGIAFLGLLYSGVLPIHMNFFTKVVMGGVMGCLFLVLIIMSFVSFKSLKGVKKSASDEDKLTEEIEKWYKENISKDNLERQLASRYTDSREESKYFVRYAAIKGLISSKFMNLDETYLDFICEEAYNYLYEE